ncbi:hypothetical protein ZIOFF_047443 [Zingiber officinale]|uniref:Uncharacterized protein n=1 Tax=Zingiber officinale TaxID=94328 RepID=A0A8J5FT63_ZINOF|nr:hypothetical protein ZIOFF_047443 [Zingiber officinale]
MDASSGSGSSPSTTQPHTLSPSKTPIIHEKVVDIRGKRKKVADVWSHTQKIIRRNDKNEVAVVVAVYNYCKTEVPVHSITHGNNSIDGHVKKCKKNPHNVVKSDSSQPILTQSSMNDALTPHIFSQKKLIDKVIAFVVKYEMSFRVVEGVGFVEMMKEAQPQFKTPNRKKIAYLFKKVFGRMTENVQFVEYFEEVDGLEKKRAWGLLWKKIGRSATKKTTSPLIWGEIDAIRIVIDQTILDATDPSLQEVDKRIESKFKKYWCNIEKVNKPQHHIDKRNSDVWTMVSPKRSVGRRGSTTAGLGTEEGMTVHRETNSLMTADGVDVTVLASHKVVIMEWQ